MTPTRLREEVRAQLDRWLADGVFEPRCDSWLVGYDEEFSRLLGARGWIGLTWPAAHGGHGLGFTERFVVTEELLRAGAPVAAHWIADRQIGPAIDQLGTEELKQAMLPRIAAGEARFCLGMSEPDAGSDLASVRTRARRIDGGWTLHGQKVWSSNAHRATHGYVLARTSDEPHKHQGLSEFVLDLAQPGVDVRRIPDLRGPGHFCEIFLDGAFVPDAWVLGEIGNGWTQVTGQLAFERGGPERFLSTYPLLRLLLDAHRDRPLPIGGLLGGLLTQLTALRQLAWRVVTAMDQGGAPVSEAAILKLLGNRFEVDVLEAARQIRHDDLTPAAWSSLVAMRDDAILAAPGFSLRGGTTEVLAVVVGRAAMGGAR